MRKGRFSKDVDYVERVFGENDAIAHREKISSSIKWGGLREGYY